MGLNCITRLRLDRRDARRDAGYHELIGDDSGVFAGMPFAVRDDVGRKRLPLLAQIAYLRRRMAGSEWK